MELWEAPIPDDDLPPAVPTIAGQLEMSASELLTVPEGRKGVRKRRGMLAWLEKSLSTRVVDEETGIEAEAGALIADKARDLALEDPLVAVKLTDMTLRAQEAAAQADDEEPAAPVAERVVVLRLGAEVVDSMERPK